MKWTISLPDSNGWYWFRHIIGSIPSDTPIHCIIMRHPVNRNGRWLYVYDKCPSAHWNGKWQPVTKLPKGYRWLWSDRPIRLPKTGGEK